jgi:hypothetical protein
MNSTKMAATAAKDVPREKRPGIVPGAVDVGVTGVRG